MVEDCVPRRHAAILAADVAGCSRHMGEDEEGTLATVSAHATESITPRTTEHRDPVVKTTGAGLLAEFARAVMPCAAHTAASAHSWMGLGCGIFVECVGFHTESYGFLIFQY